MVETAIYILLGALASALLALLALPAVSRRAYRLARRRAELTAPLSASEARAERDALRGRHAVELAQVERRAAQARDDRAVAQIELGRRATELLQRDATLAEKAQEIARQREELAALGAELRARETEIGARETAMRDAHGQRDAAQLRLGNIVARLEGAVTLAGEERAHRMKLESQIAALTLALDQARPVPPDAGEDQEPDALPRARLPDLLSPVVRSEGFDEIHDRLVEAASREYDLSLRVKALAAARHEAEAALRGARNERDAALRELARLRGADADLREAIARLGHDIVARHGPEAAREAAQTFVSQT